MNAVQWFHRGTAPMVAIYPDNVEGGALSPMSVAAGLRPVRWEHDGSGPAMAIYGEETLRSLPLIDRDPGLAPVRWFHSGRYPITANFNEEFSSGGGEEYEGPLDIVGGAVFAAGQRALSAAMLGEPLYTLRRSSDNAELEFSSDELGDSPIADINTWKGGGNAFFKVWNDHSGNGRHATKTNAANQIQWSVLAASARPTAGPGGSTKSMQTAPDITWVSGTPLTVFMVTYAHADDNADGGVICVTDATGAFFDCFGYAAGVGFDILGEDGNTFTQWYPEVFPVELEGLHIIEITVSAAGVVSLWLDGVSRAMTRSGDQQVLPGTTEGMVDISTAYKISTTVGHGGHYESLMWPSEISAPNRLAIRQNIAAYYGITLP